MPPLLGDLMQRVRVSGQGIGDTDKRRSILTRPDRCLRLARRRLDRRSLPDRFAAEENTRGAPSRLGLRESRSSACA